jgi:hypothetical protein
VSRDGDWLSIDIFAYSRSHTDAAGQGHHAAHAVNDARTGKIDGAVTEVPVHSTLGEPTATPHPRGENAIDGGRHGCVQTEVAPTPPFRHSPCGDRDGGLHEDRAAVESANGRSQQAIEALERAKARTALSREGARLLVELCANVGDFQRVVTSALELVSVLGTEDIRLIVRGLEKAGESRHAATLAGGVLFEITTATEDNGVAEVRARARVAPRVGENVVQWGVRTQESESG